MENISVITDLIIKEATEKSENILADAQSELAVSKEQQEKQLQVEYENTKKDSKKRIQSQQSDILDRKNMWAKKEISSYKQELFLSVFNLAEEKLNNLSKDEFLAFFIAAIEKCSLKGDCTIVFGDRNQAKLTIEDMQQIKGNGKEFTVIISDELLENQGGFIVIQDILEYDFKYKSLLNELNTREGGEILNMLFE